LTGYLDPRHPHSINNLIVELFGTEEVIAVVRDDGDVDAFLTRHIVQAIERRNEPGSTIGIQGDEIRPFFQSNVGISAWGLAIHSEARILATSSNAHEVRVFKFGLLKTDDVELSPTGHHHSSSDARSQSSNGKAQQQQQQQQQRDTDVTHHVLNGQTNIPYISFCNTGDDPEARWLLTTDISGVCRVMDLHSLEPVQAFRFGRSFATAQSGGFDRLNAGWAIMFLDRRSFRVEHDGSSALGVEDCDGLMPKLHRNGEVWDLSNTTRKLEEFSEPFMSHPPQTGPRDDGATQPQTQGLNLDVDDDDSMESADSSDDGGADVDIEIDMEDVLDGLDGDELRDEELHDDGLSDDGLSDGDLHDDALNEDELNGDELNRDGAGGIEVEVHEATTRRVVDVDDEMEYRSAEEDGSDSDESMPEASRTADPEPEEPIGQILIDDANDPDEEGTEDTISYTSFYSGESIVGNDPRFVHPERHLCDGVPCPILHASVRNVYLLQPPKQKHLLPDNGPPDSATAFHPPMLGLANPLKQPIHQNFSHLRMFERLNMNASIPSLGVVIVASQKGRALILSLTKMTPSTKFPPSLKDFSCQNKSVYGMKVEAILPFAEQERQNQRSGYPLHGIAASPLQGSEGKRSGRWRLMMMYQDHSILSYELSRRNAARDSGVDVGAVVV
jgi:hypothetical protein